jgi:hypothetical protein
MRLDPSRELTLVLKEEFGSNTPRGLKASLQPFEFMVVQNTLLMFALTPNVLRAAKTVLIVFRAGIQLARTPFGARE